MFEKRYRLNLVFNANKVYDRQVIEGIGEYLHAAQCDWDVYFEDDFRCRLDALKYWEGDGIIADFDNPEVEEILKHTDIPTVAVGGSYHHKEDYPRLPYVATDNAALVHCAYHHLKRKACQSLLFMAFQAPFTADGPASENMLLSNKSVLMGLSLMCIKVFSPRQKSGRRLNVS